MSGTLPIPVFSDPRMLEHNPGAGHPERPDRLRAALAAVRACDVEIDERAPRQVRREELEWLHTPEYIDSILALAGESRRLDADTSVSPGSVVAARLAAGAAIELVDSLLDSATSSRGMTLARPPGHHAEADRAMGFCLFGSIALAAVHAIEVHGLERVLIIDWDVHHGNGTQHLLESRADIMVVNLHQAGIYPGTGALTETGVGAGKGATVNIPLPGGSAGGEYTAAFEDVVIPVADRFKPQLVLVSAGFDGHAWDPLAGQELQTRDFGAMCHLACEIATKHCAGRIGLVLEGGYDLDGLSESVVACLRVLDGATTGEVHRNERAAGVLSKVRELHGL